VKTLEKFEVWITENPWGDHYQYDTIEAESWDEAYTKMLEALDLNPEDLSLVTSDTDQEVYSVDVCEDCPNYGDEEVCENCEKSAYVTLEKVEEE